jgi:hypothetical protein
MQGFIVGTLAKGMESEFAHAMAQYVQEGKVRPARAQGSIRRALATLLACGGWPGGLEGSAGPWPGPPLPIPNPAPAPAPAPAPTPAPHPRPPHPPPQVKVVEDITEGLANIGQAFTTMMRGGNRGKAVVKVAARDPYPTAPAAPAGKAA